MTTVAVPTDVKVVSVESAEQMAKAVEEEIADKTLFIASAAVADYRPAAPSTQKIKKNEQTLTISLEKTPDILSNAASRRRDGLLIIGFAAETENVLDNARAKLRSKKHGNQRDNDPHKRSRESVRIVSHVET
jgi:phosphopantothenoylcysteine decarboxylase/phosphopantothenate--cysteine ligase